MDFLQGKDDDIAVQLLQKHKQQQKKAPEVEVGQKKNNKIYYSN